MARLVGCQLCPGFARWDALICDNCNGHNARLSYTRRTSALAACIYAAAVEEMRTRHAVMRAVEAIYG